MSDDLPVPVGILVAAAVLGFLFIGVAIALCCYYCIPRDHPLRRRCDRSKRRTSPVDGASAEIGKDDCWGRCCPGTEAIAPWRPSYSPTPAEVKQGVILVQPYVIEPDDVEKAKSKPCDDCCDHCYPCCYPCIQEPVPSPKPIRPLPSPRPLPRPRQSSPPRPAPVPAPVPVPVPEPTPAPDLRFTRTLTNQTITSFPKRVTFECELNKPNVDVIWTKNGFPVDTRRAKAVANGRTHQLVIDKADPNEEGVYACTVPSSREELKTTGQLNISTKPELKLDKYVNKTTEIKVGSTVYFHIPYSGRPKPTFTMTHNGKPLPDENRMILSEVGKDTIAIFTVTDTVRSDTGKYTIKAVNSSGQTTGDFLLAVKDRPSVPRNFTAKDVTGTNCKLLWQVPTDDGDSPLENYVVERKGPKDKQFQPIGKYTPETLQTNVLDLEPTSPYAFRVGAVNKYGTSDWAPLDLTTNTNLMVPSKPEPPLVSEISKAKCRTNWIPPASDGGSPITNYVLQYSEANTNNWQPVPRQPSSITQPLTHPISNLPENKKYQFRVAATNKVGQGPFSDPSVPVSPKDEFTLPSKPLPPSVSNISKSKCNVNWVPPASNGGTPLTGYVIEKAEAGTNKWEPATKPDAATPLTAPLNNLNENAKHQFRVAAENKVGLGPFSDPSEPIQPKDALQPPGKPEPPKVSDVGKSNCKVNWQAPQSDGPITKYHLEQKKVEAPKWEPANTPYQVPTAPPLTASITNLKDKTPYQFRVAAENKGGKGLFSEPSDPIKPEDPLTVPGKPGKPAVSDVTDNSCKLNWTPPEQDGGSPVVSYVVRALPRDPEAEIREIPVAGPRLNHPIRNLAPEETYDFRVRAVNKIGTGEPSDPSDPVKTKKPTPKKEPTMPPPNEPTPRPFKEPTPPPPKEPTPPPPKKPTPRPDKEPLKTTPRPVEKPTPPPPKEATPRPVKEPLKKTTPRPVKEPTQSPPKEATPRPVKKPTQPPPKEPTPRPAKEPPKAIPRSTKQPKAPAQKPPLKKQLPPSKPAPKPKQELKRPAKRVAPRPKPEPKILPKPVAPRPLDRPQPAPSIKKSPRPPSPQAPVVSAGICDCGPSAPPPPRKSETIRPVLQHKADPPLYDTPRKQQYSTPRKEKQKQPTKDTTPRRKAPSPKHVTPRREKVKVTPRRRQSPKVTPRRGRPLVAKPRSPNHYYGLSTPRQKPEPKHSFLRRGKGQTMPKKPKLYEPSSMEYKPPFDTHFGFPINSINNKDITRKVTQF